MCVCVEAIFAGKMGPIQATRAYAQIRLLLVFFLRVLKRLHLRCIAGRRMDPKKADFMMSGSRMQRLLTIFAPFQCDTSGLIDTS